MDSFPAPHGRQLASIRKLIGSNNGEDVRQGVGLAQSLGDADLLARLRSPHEIHRSVRAPWRQIARLLMLTDDENIEVACVGGREPIVRKRKLLCDIVEPRMEEIYRLIEREIQASNFADVLGSGVVITGGTSLLPGCAELGEDVLGLPVRVGYPRQVGGLRDMINSPVFSTALG